MTCLPDPNNMPRIRPNADAGVLCKLFDFYIPVGCTTRNANDGEISAIRFGLEQLSCSLDKSSNIVILAESQAALHSIKSLESRLSSGDILKCQISIKNLQQLGKSFALQ
ncbi:hypothetical protein TNIN_154321 [Trichonephila inaurata madagascariensis]|uniref:Uncharacterized protein n=1 Tax=Trichonephila inaurata madagascariensis TaxID=2747483 RepID=A0A8X6MID8_9ARAC|nr:hypothetical protein TNIN_154321 [Trichonephila inaurata madagascariensis]